MENLKERQWPSRMLCRFEIDNILHPGCCNGCNEPLKKWKGEYYGTISDNCTVFDYEYSYFTGYCEECAKKEAEKSRKAYHHTCPPVVEYVDNIHDNGRIYERRVYADGSIVEG